MTLPTSGLITFTNVKTEFSDSNPVNLSEFYAGGPYVGANAINVPASGHIFLSDLYGVSNAWLNSYSGSGVDYYDIQINSAGTFLYFAGAGSLSSMFAVKVNADSGAIVWQKQLGVNAFYQYVALDSSDNSYYTGSNNNAAPSRAPIVKYNSSGTLQWQTSFYNVASNRSALGYGIDVDSSGNIYLLAQGIPSSNINDRSAYIVKMDGTPTITWQRRFAYSSFSTPTVTPTDLKVDSSGNVYAIGYASTTSSSATEQPFIVKYDTNGTIQWQKTTGVNNDRFVKLDIDSSNNIYVIMRAGGFPATSSTVFKIDTSGNIVWQRTITSASFNGVSCDPSGNIFVTTGGGNIIKYNSSGTIQSQSRLYALSSGGSTGITRAVVGSSNIPYAIFVNDLARKIAVNSYLPSTVNINFPGVGGLYYIYSAFTPSDSAGSYSFSNATLVDQAGAFALATTSLTETSGSVSITKVNSAY
jgi:hypothetical protein